MNESQQQKLIREKLHDIFVKRTDSGSGKVHTFEALLTMLILIIWSYIVANQSYQIVVVTFFVVMMRKQKKKRFIDEKIVIYLGIGIQITNSVVLIIQNSNQLCQNFLITIAFLLFACNRYQINRTLVYSVSGLNLLFQFYSQTHINLTLQYTAILAIGVESSLWYQRMINHQINHKLQEFNNELTNILKVVRTPADSQLNTRANDLLKKLRMLKFKRMVSQTKEHESSQQTRNFSLRQLPDDQPFFRKGQRMMSSATDQQCRNYENSNSASFQELEEITIEDIDDLLNLLSGKKEQIWLPKFLSSNTEEYSTDAKEFLLSHFTEPSCDYIHDQRDFVLESHHEPIDFNADFLETVPTRKYLELCLQLFNRFKVSLTLKIAKPEILGEFVMKVDKSYFQNLYHNSMHALDVMNSSAFFLENGLNHLIDEFEQACLLISSLGHDIGHPGLNNGFMTSNRCKLALLYNDQSVLENYHAFLLFQILKQEQCNLMANLGPVEQKGFRKYCLNMILDTDLTRHFQLMNKFQNYLELAESEDLDKSLVMSICIKCADVGHGAKQLSMHKQWSRRIIEEFFLQGDLEQHLGVPISPMCDRKQSVSKSQEGFLKAIVLPMFSAFSNLLQDDLIKKICMHQIHENIQYWQQQQFDEEFMRETHIQGNGIEFLKKFLNQPLQLSV